MVVQSFARFDFKKQSSMIEVRAVLREKPERGPDGVA